MNAEALVSQVKDLAAPSPAVIKLLDLLNKPDADADQVIRVVQTDGVLSVKLLSLCNSAWLGLTTPVSSVDQAVLQVGYQKIHRLVLAVGFGDALRRALVGYAIDESELWKHSLTTALLTQQVLTIGKLTFADPSIAYTAGLVHDIGKLVLNQVLDPAAQTAIQELIASHGHSRLEAEKSVIGTDHPEVGACLLKKWRIPESIVEAVANHHQPVLTPQPTLSAVVHVANAVAHEVGSAPGWESFAVPVSDAAMKALKIGPKESDRMLMSACDAIRTVAELAAVA